MHVSQSDLGWTSYSLSSGVWPGRGDKEDEMKETACATSRRWRRHSLRSSIPKSRFVCPPLVSLLLMSSQDAVELAVAEIANIWNRKCLWCLLTTNIISQLLSLRCKEWLLEMKINSMQIAPASGFINFIINIKCLITAYSTVNSAAAFKTCLWIQSTTKWELKWDFLSWVWSKNWAL